jgi:hypothetical protein
MRLFSATSALLLACVSQPAVATAQDAATSQASQSICIALPRVQILGGDAAAAATGLRDMFASYLTGPTLTPVLLESRLTSQAMEEARQKPCERVLLSSLSQKRKGGSRLGKVLGGAAETALWHAPGGNRAGRAAEVAAARAISTVSSTTRARDEFTLEYRLETPDGKPLLRSTSEKRKASADGEDLLTPLVEKASESVAAAIR